jgi:hypothetical protein
MNVTRPIGLWRGNSSFGAAGRARPAVFGRRLGHPPQVESRVAFAVAVPAAFCSVDLIP